MPQRANKKKKRLCAQDAVGLLFRRLIGRKNISEALPQLEGKLHDLALLINLMSVFNHYFPKEARRYGNLPIGLEREVLLDLHSLIDRNLFPMPEHLFYEGEVEEYLDTLLHNIAVEPLRYSYWDRGIDDLYPAERAILKGCGRIDDHNNVVYSFETIDWKYLKKITSDLAEPLSFIPDVAGLLLGETGNYWLDEEPESCLDSEVPWSIENVEWMRSMYEQANTFWQKKRRLVDWAEERAGRPEQIEDLVRKAYQRSLRRKDSKLKSRRLIGVLV